MSDNVIKASRTAMSRCVPGAFTSRLAVSDVGSRVYEPRLQPRFRLAAVDQGDFLCTGLELCVYHAFVLLRLSAGCRILLKLSTGWPVSKNTVRHFCAQLLLAGWILNSSIFAFSAARARSAVALAKGALPV